MVEIGVPIPVGGNAFITESDQVSLDEITDTGLTNWTTSTTICSLFVHLSRPGTFILSVRLAVPSSGQSQIRVSLANATPVQSYDVTAEGEETYVLRVGTFNFNIATGGYAQITFQGLSRTGPYYAEVYEVIISQYTAGRLHFVDHDFSYYFGRRGPSVHLRPLYPTDRNLEYSYNEIVVPTGQDVIGSYYMATGFFGGYFGFQVNSETERRILFSIWSAYDTDDPGQVPEDYKVVLLRRGENVLVQEFGDEGTGLQSILLYDWVPGRKYKFLVYGAPNPETEDETIYTAWFCPAETGQWQLMASFMRPKTRTYLVSLYAFLENFIPNQGHVERSAFFENQWVRDTGGVWQEIVGCRFTGDATSRESRLDYAGGYDQTSGKFYLRNCGFFHDRVNTNIQFIREPTNLPPEVEIEELP